MLRMNGWGNVEEGFALLNFQGETEVSLVKMWQSAAV